MFLALTGSFRAASYMLNCVLDPNLWLGPFSIISSTLARGQIFRQSFGFVDRASGSGPVPQPMILATDLVVCSA